MFVSRHQTLQWLNNHLYKLKITSNSLKNQVFQTLKNDLSVPIHEIDPQVSYIKAVIPLDYNSVDNDHDSSERSEVSWQSRKGNHQRLKEMTGALYQDKSWPSRSDFQYPKDIKRIVLFLEYDKAIVFKPQHLIVSQSYH
jgi:hypothetical protein